jgi:hypothetical protein
MENPPRDYIYWTDCVSSVGELIDEMRDHEDEQEVTYDTMLRHADGLLDWAVDHNFERRSTSGHGLTLKNDWSVSYHRSLYCNVPCYYLVWSGIEHIWIRKGFEEEVQDCEEAARAAAPPSTSLLARPNPEPYPFAEVIVPDSSWFDPDELWGRLIVHGSPACDLAHLSGNPPPAWLPLVEFDKDKAQNAVQILKSYGIKVSTNSKTLLCLNMTRALSCMMTRWCEKFCYGKSQNFCRENAVKSLLDNFDAFEFLAKADQQIVEDVAWALMTIALAHGISNMRVPGIGDFTPGLIRVVDAMTAADPEFTVWGFTRKAHLCSQLMPVRDNLVIWSSIDAAMPRGRLQHAFDFAKKHKTGISYSTEFGLSYQPRNGKDPEPPWWDPPMYPSVNQEMAGVDPFLEDLMKKRKVDVIFGYHGRGYTTHVDVSMTSDMCLEPTFGYPECPATDPLGGGHFVATCQECYWCIEKRARKPHRDLAEHRLNTVAVIPIGKWQGTRVLLDTGERV